MAFGLGSKKEDKVVLAHFMLGNTYSYTPDLWKRQMQLAGQAGIDGFSLNLGPEGWQLQQALVAVSLCPAEFKLLLSLDMNVLPQDAQTLVSTILAFYHGPHVLRRGTPPRPVLSTFGGGDASFGGVGWGGFLGMLKEKGLEVFFLPSFFLPPHEILNNPIVDGAFAWNNGWPLNDGPLTTREDEPFLKSRKPYMAAVSPCFSTHYGTEPPRGWNKNWIYASDDNLYATRWEQIIAMKPEMVQIISWNDFGESHYIGPVEGSQPGSEAWTDGMSHEGWLEMTKWFVAKYKTGREEILEEKIIFAHRPHSKHVEALQDRVGRPNHSHRARDFISFTCFLTQPCFLDVLLTSSPSAEDSAQSLTLPKGYSRHILPFSPGTHTFLAFRTEVGEVGRASSRVEAESRLYNFNFTTGVFRLAPR